MFRIKTLTVKKDKCSKGTKMRETRSYTEQELDLVRDILLTSNEIAMRLNVCAGTVNRLRNKLGVKTPIGAKPNRSNPKKMRQTTRKCISTTCNNTFTVVQSSKKKYCSHSCQQTFANVAKKGVGSRKIRNPNISEYRRYSRAVHRATREVYKEHIDIINPNRYTRTLCGVAGGWQLDHIISIKECFARGLSINEAAAVTNLRMLPWKDNLMRQYSK